MAAPSPFKVIIVGGSLVGLTNALILERAGIDYVLLEKREIAPNLGASISTHPHTQRVMEQLGVWPEIEASVIPLVDRRHYDEFGTLFEESNILREISKMTMGRCTAFMERQFWLSCIHNQIQDKSRIRPRTGVASFVETDDGVEVTTENGEVIKGDMLIGADGIHSSIRNQMATHISSTDPAAAKELREGFDSTYQCIFATSKNINSKGEPFLSDGSVDNVYYHGFSGVAAAGVKGLIFWFLFLKSDKVTKMPHTPRFSDTDTLDVISKYGHHALGSGYTFKDLWDQRVKADMLPLQEGVLSTKWNTGKRVVLMGDAVHKATVNPGLGGNLAVEGATHLANELIPLVRQCQEDGARKPSVAELVTAFDTYETKHRPHAKMIVTMSGYITRYEAMETWWLRGMRRISPWVSDITKANGLVTYINEAPWLNFLPNPDDTRKVPDTD